MPENMSKFLIPLKLEPSCGISVESVQRETAEALANAIGQTVDEMNDDDQILLPPRSRQDNTIQRARRLKLIFKLLSEGMPIHKACEQFDLDNWTFSRIVSQHTAWKRLYKEAIQRQTEKLKDMATSCALKALDDPRYLRALEFTLKMREGYFKPTDKQIIVQAPSTTIERKVVYEEIPTSQRKPPLRPEAIADPSEVCDG